MPKFQKIVLFPLLLAMLCLSGCQTHDLTPQWWNTCELEQGLVQKPLLRLAIWCALLLSCVTYVMVCTGAKKEELGIPWGGAMSFLLMGPLLFSVLLALLSYVFAGDVYYFDWWFLVFWGLWFIFGCIALAAFVATVEWARTIRRHVTAPIHTGHRRFPNGGPTPSTPKENSLFNSRRIIAFVFMVLEIIGIIFTIRDIVGLFNTK